MKNILKVLSLCCVLLFAVGCEEENGIGETSNVVTFESGSPVEFVEVGGTRTASVTIYAGNVSGSDRTIGIGVDDATTLDASAYSVPSTVTIPGGTNEATLEYQITDSNIPLSGAMLVIAITDPNGLELTYGASTSGTAPSYSSIAITVEYENCPPSNEVVVDITTDNWPDETTWSVEDSSGNEVGSGGPYANPADDFTTISSTLCLPAGTYTFTLLDSFGDGGSSYEVSTATATISGAVTGTSVTDTFTVD